MNKHKHFRIKIKKNIKISLLQPKYLFFVAVYAFYETGALFYNNLINCTLFNQHQIKLKEKYFKIVMNFLFKVK